MRQVGSEDSLTGYQIPVLRLQLALDRYPRSDPLFPILAQTARFIANHCTFRVDDPPQEVAVRITAFLANALKLHSAPEIATNFHVVSVTNLLELKVDEKIIDKAHKLSMSDADFRLPPLEEKREPKVRVRTDKGYESISVEELGRVAREHPFFESLKGHVEGSQDKVVSRLTVNRLLAALHHVKDMPPSDRLALARLRNQSQFLTSSDHEVSVAEFMYRLWIVAYKLAGAAEAPAQFHRFLQAIEREARSVPWIHDDEHPIEAKILGTVGEVESRFSKAA